jgi:hypothetical protein
MFTVKAPHEEVDEAGEDAFLNSRLTDLEWRQIERFTHETLIQRGERAARGGKEKAA